MTYAVKEIIYTLQGEGANAGRSAVFCRFSGCNLWTGREQDRGGAICTRIHLPFDSKFGTALATPQYEPSGAPFDLGVTGLPLMYNRLM